jgi:DNA-binding response OmpR family regulator
MNPTILLVDDDLEVLHGLMRNLRKEPYQFRTAYRPRKLWAFSRAIPST